MKIKSVILACLTVLLVFTTTATADDHQEFCENYAALAVEQINQAQSRACGPFPQNEAAWYGDYAAHYAICMQTDEMNAMAMMRGRHDHLLASCPNVAARYRCAVYSLETMAHVAANRNLGCGFNESQPRWTPRFRPHFDWCEGSQPAQSDLDTRTKSRTELINQCVAKQGGNKEQGTKQGEFPVYSPDTALANPNPGPGGTPPPAPSNGGGSGSSTDDFSMHPKVPDEYEHRFQGDDYEVAARRDMCLRFANISIKQAEEYWGHCDWNTYREGWSPTWEDHFEHCLDWPDDCEENIASREKFLTNDCHMNDPAHVRCYDYAAKSVILEKYNRNRRCNLNGSYWHDDLEKHYEHCMKYNMNQGEIDAAMEKRTQEINCY